METDGNKKCSLILYEFVVEQDNSGVRKATSLTIILIKLARNTGRRFLLPSVVAEIKNNLQYRTPRDTRKLLEDKGVEVNKESVSCNKKSIQVI